LAPAEFEKLRGGPWPKKVVHHWRKTKTICTNTLLDQSCRPPLHDPAADSHLGTSKCVLKLQRMQT